METTSSLLEFPPLLTLQYEFSHHTRLRNRVRSRRELKLAASQPKRVPLNRRERRKHFQISILLHPSSSRNCKVIKRSRQTAFSPLYLIFSSSCLSTVALHQTTNIITGKHGV